MDICTDQGPQTNKTMEFLKIYGITILFAVGASCYWQAVQPKTGKLPEAEPTYAEVPTKSVCALKKLASLFLIK